MRLYSKFVKWPASVKIGTIDHAFGEYPTLPEDQKVFSVSVNRNEAAATVAELRELADDLEKLI